MTSCNGWPATVMFWLLVPDHVTSFRLAGFCDISSCHSGLSVRSRWSVWAPVVMVMFCTGERHNWLLWPVVSIGGQRLGPVGAMPFILTQVQSAN